jgi:glycosyltransferase involved in cell wall biosynthesis
MTEAQSPLSSEACRISVITCSHEPRPDYLKRVFDSLAAQSVAPSSWEYILIDSASSEALATRVDLSWHPHARCIREEELGLTRARLRGIAESRGDLLIFVDDDNALDVDFIEQARHIYMSRPEMGAWSGATRPCFEQPPPAWTRAYWGNLVIREVPRDLWSNLPALPQTMPCGAGLCVRRDVAAYYSMLHETGNRPFQLDRVGNSVLSGGDNDLAACACDIGLGVGIFRSLSLTHLIPPSRLDEDYLVQLAEGVSLSAILVRSLRDPGTAAQSPTWKRRVADTLRLLFKNRRQRRFHRATLRGEQKARRVLNRRLASGT